MHNMKYLIPQIPFYFIRHGQTDWNHKNMIQGHIDIPLNETGIKQAQEAVPFLIDQGITCIVTSPLLRAHKTAEIIAEALNVPLHIHDDLKERCLGALEGTVKTKSATTCIATNYTQSAEDSENVEVFKKRIANALHDILHPDHTTLVVAHGGVYWALMQLLDFGHQKSLNATPYFFKPAKESNQEWLVSSINDQ